MRVCQEAQGHSCQGLAVEQTYRGSGLVGGGGSIRTTWRHPFLPAQKHQPHAQPRTGTIMGHGPGPTLAERAQSRLAGTAKATAPQSLKGTVSPAHLL